MSGWLMQPLQALLRHDAVLPDRRRFRACG
jgi:hypothetical protein